TYGPVIRPNSFHRRICSASPYSRHCPFATVMRCPLGHTEGTNHDLSDVNYCRSGRQIPAAKSVADVGAGRAWTHEIDLQDIPGVLPLSDARNMHHSLVFIKKAGIDSHVLLYPLAHVDAEVE